MLVKIKKYISIISIISVLFSRVAPALAQEAPTAPTPPPEPTLTETAPTPPPEPVLDQTAPTPPPAPILEESTASINPESDPQETVEEENQSDSSNANSSSSTSGNQTGNQSADGQTGSATIDSGDATNTAGVSTIANTNTSAGVVGSGTGSVGVINSGNGSDSSNSGSVGIVDNNNTYQNNSASVSSNLDQTTTTGENSTSQNVGNSSITTGDANTSGTIITAVNTNRDGVAVAEFTIADDHIGDIILDFSSSCIYGCDGGDLTAKNTGNGTGSDNDAAIDQTTNNNVVQVNDATLLNDLTLSSDSGNNLADENTNGDSSIATGDANVAGNVLNFANNNLSGGVYLNFVYIYGDLIGDIILPEEYFSQVPCSSCGGDISAANTDNGSNSTNDASVDQATNNNTAQFNRAEIDNNLLLSATTGDNQASANTGGDTSIETGDTSIDAQVLNVANSNISGGDWWLVLINEAGNWIGRILGAPAGTTFAGSDGTQFSVNENGEITAVNSGNGSGSDNNANVSQTANNTTVQTNNANIVNNLNLSANTGGNSASKNTGGNSEIKTGDANIIASIVNMVNNNISGGGRLFVTVVDVFGSWIGDFVGPGYKKETTQANTQGTSQDSQNPAGGTTGTNSSNSTSNSSSGGDSGGNSSTNNSSPSTQTTASNLPVHSAANLLASTLVQVAGYQANTQNTDTLTQGSQAEKKNIKINLAWLLLIAPGALVSFVIFRKYGAALRG